MLKIYNNYYYSIIKYLKSIKNSANEEKSDDVIYFGSLEDKLLRIKELRWNQIEIRTRSTYNDAP
jgi:hypothetical protein